MNAQDGDTTGTGEVTDGAGRAPAGASAGSAGPRVLRSLGQTDVRVTPVGLGCWQFSEGQGMAGKFWPSLDRETAQQIVEASLDGGIQWFDTAEMYGNGASERVLAQALTAAGRAPARQVGTEQGVVVATKWWPMLRTAGSLTRTIDERLAALEGFPIDLHQVHQPLSLATVKGEMQAMAELLRAGSIRAAGVSNYGAGQMRRAHAALEKEGYPLASNQVRYSLLDRRIERNGVLEAARERGVTIIAYSPLAQGLLTGKFHEDPEAVKKRAGPRKWLGAFRSRGLEKSRPVIEALRTVAEKYGVTPGQAALRWLVQFHHDTVVVIPGATKQQHAEQNTGVLDFALDDGDLALLERVSRDYK
jgi:aryl-alcohol dehydrogenase-like predicted oxidoreductase